VDATAHFTGGSHISYKFDAAGRIIGSRQYTLSRASQATASSRHSIPGRAGAWLQIANGVWAGYWIREAPNLAFIQGMQSRTVSYNPPRPVSFAAGTYSGYTFDAAGHVITRKTGTLSRSSPASTTMRAIINGSTYLRISSGTW